MAVFQDTAIFQGDVIMLGAKPEIARDELLQSNNDRFKIQPTDWRIWDAFASPLTGTAGTDDLGLIGGTFGTNSPTIQTGDLKNAGSTSRYARCTFQLPSCYVAGQSVTVRAHAGMKTTVASTAATVDFEVYRSNDEEGIGSDLCTTAATTINSLTDTNVDFAVTSASLSPGDTLDIRMTVLVNDTATGTAVIGQIGSVELLLDVKG